MAKTRPSESPDKKKACLAQDRARKTKQGDQSPLTKRRPVSHKIALERKVNKPQKVKNRESLTILLSEQGWQKQVDQSPLRKRRPALYNISSERGRNELQKVKNRESLKSC